MFSDPSVEDLCTAIAAALDAEIDNSGGPAAYSSLWSVEGLDLPGLGTGFGLRCERAFDEHPLVELLGVRVTEPETLGVVLVSEASAYDMGASSDRRDVRILYVLLRDGTETVLLHHHDAPFSPVEHAGASVSGKVSCALRRVLDLPSRAGECGPLPTPAEIGVRRALTLALMIHEIAGDDEVLVEGVRTMISCRPAERWSDEYENVLAATRASLDETDREGVQREVLERRLWELEWLDHELFALFSHENTPTLTEIRSELADRVVAGELSIHRANEMLAAAGLTPEGYHGGAHPPTA